ncbi:MULTISPECIES: glutaminase A [Empedobacter]|uniref:Glutaminase n=1 Tax=Empedobacter stercoris TaxID=1628248 RepID=A0ABX1WKG5_9FLAO|nr:MULTISPECIES: glutaminase A [Empedobacter]MCA4777361.1 glutaminase A [Empedobacter stercoris]MCA4809025.1 glutaminase A [Empedobacter stercoris]MDM1521992.1 glutaminase A [Empedobacter sp. 225-1]MDM1542261.1 glutaminase A [Empedobacter sp. 189-2]NOJ75169.1 glutaminase A [Empedobacter stercoris]
MKRYTFSTLLLSLTLTCFNPINQQVFGQKTTINTGKSLQITENALTTILEKNRANYKEGKVADYIPELGKMKADKIAFSVVDENGKVINVGDVNQKFTIQSISKIIALMIAVSEKGEENVFSKMGYYGTNMPFNHFANLETTGKPLNPMMNAGAILTTSMIDGEGEIPFQKILKMVRYITKNNSIDYSKSVYNSEKETGHRNRGMFYLMKNNGLIEGDEEKLNNYFKQCSIEITTEDLAKIGYFFAHQCTRFDGDTTYKNAQISQLIQSQMLTAGMYEFSGEYARTVGLPSKSGVGGGITVSVPNKIGIGVFSPALDKHGNSAAGYHMILDLVKQYNLSLFQ